LPDEEADMYEYTINLRSRMAKAHAYVRKNMHSAVDRQHQAYYKDRRTYQPTQPVWLWKPRLRPGQTRKFALYWTGTWQIKRQLNELMYKSTPHHSWARQGSKAVSIDRLKPFQAMYLDALEHHCPPDPKADLKMLGDQFAKFIDTDLEEEINAEGKDREEWTPKRQMGSTGIRGSLFLLPCWYGMLLPRKTYAEKDTRSTNDTEQSKKEIWFTTIKLPTDVIELLPKTPAIRTTTRP
jgi:hypothetical protein